MAVVTVVAVNVNGASSGVALLGRVLLAVVAGGASYVATAAFLGARDAARRRGRRGGAPPAGPIPPSGGTPPGAGPSPGPVARPADIASAGPFRGKLDGQPDTPPVRLLGPVREGPRNVEGEEESHGQDPGRHR